MNRATLEWYELLARGLIWAGGIVLLLSVVGAVVIAGSETALPLLEDAERQGRGIAALASLGGGLTSAGLLAGIGALLRLRVSERLSGLDESAGAAERDDPDPPPAKPPARTGRAADSGGETVAAKKRPRKASGKAAGKAGSKRKSGGGGRQAEDAGED